MARANVKSGGVSIAITEASIVGSFFDQNGRLPAFAQRRLDFLLAKNKTRRGLTPDEERELEEMLEYIDQKTIEMLAYRMATLSHRRPGPRSPQTELWTRYINRRLKKL